MWLGGGGEKCGISKSDSFSLSLEMTITVSPSELKILEDALLNTPGNVVLHERFRALFTLKALKSEEAVQIISKGLFPILSEVIFRQINGLWSIQDSQTLLLF